MRLLITAAAATLALTGCAQTKYKSTTTHPDGTVTEWGGKLTGNYGLVPSSTKRGNLGDGGRGGLLGAILPGFNYKDATEREFAESRQDTFIKMGAEGLTIHGPTDHGTGTAIAGDAVNRGIRNVSTLVGWLGLMGTAEALGLAKEATKRLDGRNATDVKLQELFTAEELAELDAGALKAALAE
jgi:hypothetical protein